jgi:cytochrome c-type biogenesis protein CcmH/NrfG
MVAGVTPSEPLPPRAAALLHQVAAVRPDHPQVLWYLGLEAVRAGHRDEAKHKWTRLLAELPPNSQDASLVRKALDAIGGSEQR